ncbi:MAG: M48 family metalloprotease [Lewinellaceae bacterium]|nr:M48 family metalloprotease [Lewinella sp.]MCB9277319.1 M48 family metalloprotease [Lewinellaceae bacterium]
MRISTTGFRILLGVMSVLATAFSPSCSTSKGGNFNLYNVNKDIRLGKEVKREIERDPGKYPILPETGNEAVYGFLRHVAGKILDSGKVEHRNDFAWEIHILQDDETLNAFCTPGGYIYVYTGLMLFLDTEDQLAGVLGHEIAHADLRHSTRQLTSRNSAAVFTSVLTNNAEPGVLENVALGLLSLKFSRSHETEADLKSVEYLCGSGYKAGAAAEFFKKIEGAASLPAFVSTHPSPKNRVKRIEEKESEMDCPQAQSGSSEYARVKRLLRQKGD